MILSYELWIVNSQARIHKTSIHKTKLKIQRKSKTRKLQKVELHHHGNSYQWRKNQHHPQLQSLVYRMYQEELIYPHLVEKTNIHINHQILPVKWHSHHYNLLLLIKVITALWVNMMMTLNLDCILNYIYRTSLLLLGQNRINNKNSLSLNVYFCACVYM